MGAQRRSVRSRRRPRRRIVRGPHQPAVRGRIDVPPAARRVQGGARRAGRSDADFGDDAARRAVAVRAPHIARGHRSAARSLPENAARGGEHDGRRGSHRMRYKLAALTVIAAAGMTAAVLGQATVGAPGARQPRPPSAARIAPLAESEWTAEQRAVVAKVAPAGAADPAIKTLVRLPALVQAVAPYTRYLTEESTLAPRVRHLLILRTAWLCGNDLLWSLHASGLP